MRLRLRGPEGTSTITLSDDAKISDLISEIISKTYITNFDIRYGYPPQPLLLSQHDPSLPLNKLDIKLNGEQLIVSQNDSPSPSTKVTPTITSNQESTPSRMKTATADTSGEQSREPKYSFSGMQGTPSKTTSSASKSTGPVSLTRKGIDGDVPEIPLPSHQATLVLRVMPDDNSCLFRAFGTAVLPGDDLSMHELRSLVASTIQSNPTVYSKVVLEQSPDDYCRWIQTADAWGGAIEMGILAQAFGTEVVCIDVQSLSIHKFHESQSPHRCILIYSGIHYDLLALSPSSPPHTKASGPPENDQRIFDANDDEILAKAVELCSKLKEKHYFTDTGGMAIRCNVCGTVVHGQAQAQGHASQTGHYDMAEVNTPGT